jgi:hypothetical protein
MPTSFELKQLALDLLDAGNSINSRIVSDFQNIKDSGLLPVLSNRAQELFLKSNLLLALATIQIEKEVRDSIQQLNDASAQIQNAIETISKIQKVVNIATDLVTIAVDVIGGDLSDIPGKVGDILDNI